MGTLAKGLSTRNTFIGFLSGMDSLMKSQGRDFAEIFLTVFAFQKFLSSTDLLVFFNKCLCF